MNKENQKADATSESPSCLHEWPSRQEEGEAKLFEMLAHLWGLSDALCLAWRMGRKALRANPVPPAKA